MRAKSIIKFFLPFFFILGLVCSFFAFSISSSASDYYDQEYEFLATLTVKAIADGVGEGSDVYVPNRAGEIVVPAWYVDSVPVTYGIIQFYGDDIRFRNSFGGLDVHELTFYFGFDVKFELGWNPSVSISESIYSFISEIGVTIGGSDLVSAGGSVRIIDYLAVPYPDSGYHVTGAIQLLPPSNGWSSLFSTTDKVSLIQVAFRSGNSLTVPEFYEQNDPILVLGSFHGKLVASYSSNNVYEALLPMSPQQIESLQRGQSFSDTENIGGNISSGIDDLEQMMPEVGDPFENAPTFQVYLEGSQFFTQFFNYLYNNQIIGAFISIGLIMCLIVFLMRR